MVHIRSLSLLATILLAVSAQAQSSRAPESVLIKLSPEAASAVRSEARVCGDGCDGGTRVAHPLASLPEVSSVSAQIGVTSMQRVFRTDPRRADAHRRFGVDRWYQVEVPAGREADAANAFRQLAAVEIAERNAMARQPAGGNEPSVSASGSGFPNDPGFGGQWAIRNTGQTGGTVDADLDIVEAWTVTTGSSAVIVHVNDSGVDLGHPDLAGAIWTNDGEIPDNGIDDDGNGYIDDVHGWNFASDVPLADTNDGHGTAVSGIIAARTHNGIGVAGVAGGDGGGGVRLLHTDWIDGSGTGTFGTIAAGLVYAADNGAVISSNSHTGGLGNAQVWIDAVDYFSSMAGGSGAPMTGGLVIASGSDDRFGVISRSDEYDGPLLVASTAHDDQKVGKSDYGPSIDVAAPGGPFPILSPGGGTATSVVGTSWAVAHVAGVAALYASAYPGASASEVQSAIEAGADPINTGFDLGAGRINAARTLGVTAEMTGAAGWRLVGLPTAQTVGALASRNLVQGTAGAYPDGSPNMLSYTSGLGWSAPSSTGTVLPRAHGLAWYLFDNDIVPDPSSFGGGQSQSWSLPHALVSPCCAATSDVEITLPTVADANGDKWMLVGNPFAGDLDLSGLATWPGNEHLASTEAQVYDPSISGYRLGTSVGPWGAFWVLSNATAPAGGQLTIPISAAPRLRSRPHVALALEGRTSDGAPLRDEAAIVELNGQAALGRDRHDAPKLVPLASRYVLLSLLAPDGDGSVAQAKSAVPPAGPTEIPLAVSSVGAEEALTLRWPTLDLPVGWTAVLVDRLLATEIDMRGADHYDLTVTPSPARQRTSIPGPSRATASADARFLLRLSPLPTSTGPQAETRRISVHPNPASSSAAVRVDRPRPGRLQVTIHDALGRTVQRVHDGHAPSEISLPMDVRPLASGVYVIRVVSDGDVSTRQLVVAR
ncbi:MAG: S8 family serine peptidase [Bacteroidota bacterium]